MATPPRKKTPQRSAAESAPVPAETDIRAEGKAEDREMILTPMSVTLRCPECGIQIGVKDSGSGYEYQHPYQTRSRSSGGEECTYYAREFDAPVYPLYLKPKKGAKK